MSQGCDIMQSASPHDSVARRAENVHVLVQSNPDVQDWMQANSLGSLSQLEGYFESRVLDLATLAGRSYIVWQVRTLF